MYLFQTKNEPLFVYGPPLYPTMQFSFDVTQREVNNHFKDGEFLKSEKK